MRRVVFSCFASIALLSLMSACGGGGGDGSSTTIQADITPSSLSLAGVEGSDATSIDLSVRFDHLPSGTIYPLIAASAGGWQSGNLTFVLAAEGDYRTTLSTDPTLSAGAYSGTLTLMLCKDAACQQQYSVANATIPYTIHVEPKLVLETSINGGPFNSGTDLSGLTPGDSVIVRSNVDVTWAQGSSAQPAHLTTVTSGARQWEGTVQGSCGKFVGLSAHTVRTSTSGAMEPANGDQVLFNFISCSG